MSERTWFAWGLHRAKTPANIYIYYARMSAYYKKKIHRLSMSHWLLESARKVDRFPITHPLSLFLWKHKRKTTPNYWNCCPYLPYCLSVRDSHSKFSFFSPQTSEGVVLREKPGCSRLHLVSSLYWVGHLFWVTWKVLLNGLVNTFSLLL